MTSNVLPLFWDLASSSKDTRLQASVNLVSSLQNFQETFLATNVDSGSDIEEEEGDEENGEDGDMDEDESGEEVDDKDEAVEGEESDDNAEILLDKALAKSNAEDVVYTVKRLVRGLGSSRESSRLGFAVALTELLSQIHTITAPQVLSLLLRSSPISASMKGSEQRDSLFARLFGLTSLIQSNSLFRPSSDQETFQRVTSELISLGDSKSWLREAAWWGLLQAVQGACVSQVEWADNTITQLLSSVLGDKGWTAERVALVSLMERLRPTLVVDSLLQPTFKRGSLLASPNLLQLAKILKESNVNEEESTASDGSSKSQLHFVWDVMLDSYFVSKPDNSQAPFQDFFRVCVDESLFANSSSSQRKYWGFQVFSRALPLLSANEMPLIFTPNFMRCWMNNLSSSDRYLHKAAQHVAQIVQDVVKTNPNVGFTLLSQLVGKHGKPNFDKITKTRTVEGIMGSLNLDGVKEYVRYLQDMIVSDDSNSEDLEGLEDKRTWALNQMVALVRNGSVPKDDQWISSVLEFLLVHGFFVILKTTKKGDITALSKSPRPPLSESTAALCRTKLLSCLVEVTTVSSPKGDGKTASRKQGCDSSNKLWLRRILELLLSLQTNPHLKIISEADKEIKAGREAGIETLKALDKFQVEGNEVVKGVEILLSFLIIQTYDENEDALEMLEVSQSSARESTSKEADVNLPAIDMLLDTLIALLDKGSNDLRSLANLVVGMVAGEFTSSSVRHLVAQLEASANVEDEDGSEEDMEELSDAGDEDQEENDSEGGQSIVEDEEEEEEDEDDDDEEELPPVDPDFRRKVAEALQVTDLLEDGVNGDNASDSSSEEEYWDDEQMMKVDEQLAAAFKQRAASNRKSDLKLLETENLHFKNRILDLFDIFIRKQPSNQAIYDTILPLLQLVRSSSSSTNGTSSLGTKATSIIRSHFTKPKEVPSPTSSLGSIMKESHQLARRSSSSEFSSLCSICSLFLLRSTTSKSSEEDEILEEYKETMRDFMLRKNSQVHVKFLSELFQRYPLRAWNLRFELLELIEKKAVNDYRQSQGLLMLSSLCGQVKIVDDKEGREFVKRASGLIVSVLEKTMEEGSTIKNQEVKEVCVFGLHLARGAKAGDMLGNWDEKFEQVTRRFLMDEKTKGMKGALDVLKQLVSVLGMDTGKKEKEKSKKDKKDRKVNKMEVDEKPTGNGETPRKKKDEDMQVDVNPHMVVSTERKQKSNKNNKKSSEAGETLSMEGLKEKSKKRKSSEGKEISKKRKIPSESAE
ncbi:hypothetical protein TREMEDRAFT_35002 [Tremella mesenterica DSM 1558]|uniref:uncharacterized protein n=1 Tax=Tremella mesenterica (strain ATCC 24925 / CBS 8224 / DSM 1558 / NBRC 9311 / NRRL Y-6157 / RJB 2259-6 / UBC 559-6) TaxID=578456 RepID=UPI00032C08ED|nr:uncharacterized protein TREMEDRAFT_35002 [Tremella mesenterica DSM 1558]EIW66554.1 hypothetical protein TREMEDRAFT_35002 [Tremella mesenterica DSM 1558]